MNDLFEKLKAHLLAKQKNYIEHHSMCGDTEGGFYSTDEFDFDKLCAEIDAFAAGIKKEERK